MTNNYVPYHMHTQLSLLDSCSKYQEYVNKAAELGMKAFAFSEHGNIYEYYHKKQAVEAAGMKYIHAVEIYITEDLKEKVRDNYHCVLLSSGYDGFLELNKLISQSWNRGNVKIVGNDDRYYYAPRFTLDDVMNTSDNIIICTACVAGILGRGSEKIKEKYIEFLTKNKHRCFLELQHHNTDSQKKLNKYLLNLHNKTGIPLICGTDTHALNEKHVKGRSILQKSKGIYFDDEEGWDLTFKSYDELIKAYKIQDVVPNEIVIEALENTNIMADMIEEFTLDTNTKYPHIYNNPIDIYKKKINEAYRNHKYLKNRYTKNQIKQVVQSELEVYIKTNSIDFMLLQLYLRDWERKNGIRCGYGRGSVSGSMIAYILGITDMDSLKFGLNFFRFMNPDRVTNADIDSDYSNKDRERVKKFLLKDHMNLDTIQCAEIITFNTIALKGSVRDVCRGLYADSGIDYLKLADEICNNIDDNEQVMREKYPEVFEYVDILNGTVVSVGSHPSGVLVTDVDLASQIGLCSLSTSDYPVSMLNMKELDSLMYIKLDILGLDNVGIINETCELIGIDRLTPDNVDLEDEAVWKSIRDDTTAIFQWESDSAQAYLKKFMSDKTIAVAKEHNENFSYIKWFSFGNGLIRPGCASFRDAVANGEVLATDFKELDEFLSVTLGRITMQEDIMQFLVRFCGYSGAESDTVRRGIAKKYGTEKFIDEIHDRFLEYSNKTYGVDKKLLEEIFPPIKQGILDASSYAFSWNHSDAYSCLGYICGYLRYYYPVEFLTTAFNIYKDKEDKILILTEYAKKHNIIISDIEFGHSVSKYSCNVKERIIYKGLGSIKYLSEQLAEELLKLSKNKYMTFVDLLIGISNTSCDSRQLNILICLNFFKNYGDINKLLKIVELYNKIYGKKQFKKEKLEELEIPEYIIKKYAIKETAKMYSGVDTEALLNEMIERIEVKKTTLIDKINYQQEYLGYISEVRPSLEDDYYYVQEISGNWLTLYQLNSGDILKIKARKNALSLNPIYVKQIIKADEIREEKKWRKVDGEWIRIDETEPILISYQALQRKQN